MSHSGSPLLTRRSAGIKLASFALAAMPLWRGVCRADATSTTRVEEDWTLQIGTPQPTNKAPQIKTYMSTQGDLLGYYACYEMNFHVAGDPPASADGGFGIEMYQPGNSTSKFAAGGGDDQLNTPDEVITWTQRLDLSNGSLKFSIRNSASTTWGSTTGEVLSQSMDCTLADLSGYDPQFSVDQGGPFWWPNQVVSMTLLAVRYYSGTTLNRTDSTSRAAYP